MGPELPIYAVSGTITRPKGVLFPVRLGAYRRKKGPRKAPNVLILCRFCGLAVRQGVAVTQIGRVAWAKLFGNTGGHVITQNDFAVAPVQRGAISVAHEA